jgi:hypothetical protein
MAKADLRIDWATHAAAKYACENWHYSKSVPVGKLVRLGVWESGSFVGVILFAWGMNKSLGTPYGLAMQECCELVRVALNSHNSPVSRMMALALKFLHKQSPGIRLVVSFADPEAGHHGGIYQAGNWIYSGKSASNYEWRLNGKRLNKRAYTGHNFGNPKLAIPTGAERVPLLGKHRYLMPLDAEMRERILPLAKPYPKRAKDQASSNPDDLGGETPTRTLQTLRIENG